MWVERGIRGSIVNIGSQAGSVAIEELQSWIPLGRFGEPSEVVGGVAYLLGGGASLVTGHTLAIDGGYTIR
jgi:NAD(P)-dependent dehydrogenase (short-subunit alcohol dehydrogenase family)